MSRDWDDHPFTDAPRDCFVCDESIDRSIPAVAWFSHDRLIAMHSDCAQRLGVNLIADSRESTLAAAPQPFWAKRVARAAGHALRVAEGVR